MPQPKRLTLSYHAVSWLAAVTRRADSQQQAQQEIPFVPRRKPSNVTNVVSLAGVSAAESAAVARATQDVGAYH
jgi:hypothetical protein